MPGAGIEPARLAAGDFESPASTNFTTRALGDRARGALERSRALYDVIKILRAGRDLGILKRGIGVCSSRGSPRLFSKICCKQASTPLQIQPSIQPTVTPCKASIYNSHTMPQR